MMRSEYPRPELERDNWICLNGDWDFAFGDDGPFDRTIRIPFCPESALSGIGHRDFIGVCRYRKTVKVPDRAESERLLLHFEAAFYRTEVRVDGRVVCVHEGGYTPFGADITDVARPGAEILLEVRCEGDARDPLQPSGKQSHKKESFSCFYTRSTGIWQTVWMETVSALHIEDLLLVPDAERGTLRASVQLSEKTPVPVELTALLNGKEVGKACVEADNGAAETVLQLSERILWEPGAPVLYDLVVKAGTDTVRSYFGLRSVAWDRYGWILNGKRVFLRFVLDQGYYPESVYTAPSDEHLQADIRMSMEAGFNGARLHERVFERRFLYHCDRMGYLVHGEYPNWGFDYTEEANTDRYVREWKEAVFRDRNHPCIIGWCPMNENWDIDGRKQSDELVRTVYRKTKEWDPTRPVIDVSWTFHVETDVYDIHDYEQNTEVFLNRYRSFADDSRPDQFKEQQRIPYDRKLPFFISEYGGFRLGDGEGWGYGTPASPEAFADQFVTYAQVMLQNRDICGFCFTQLYDVELELNGIYTFAREPKFTKDVYERFKAALSAPAAIEQKNL